MSIKIIISKELKKMFPFYEPLDFDFTYQNIENKKERAKKYHLENIAYYSEVNARINEALDYCIIQLNKRNTNYYWPFRRLQALRFRNDKIIDEHDKKYKELINWN